MNNPTFGNCHDNDLFGTKKRVLYLKKKKNKLTKEEIRGNTRQYGISTNE